MAKSKVTIHNKISPIYKQVHVDGAYGGITTRGLINLSFFAERLPIPKASDFEVNEDGFVGSFVQNSEDSKSGIIREYEFGIYMDLQTAKNLAQFISTKVSELENALLKPVKNADTTKNKAK